MSFLFGSKKTESVETQESNDLINAKNIWDEMSKEANKLVDLEDRLINGRNGRGRLFKTFRLQAMLPTTESVRKDFIVPVKDALLTRVDELKKYILSDDLSSLVEEAYNHIYSLKNCLKWNTYQCRDEELSHWMIQVYKFFQDHPRLEVIKQGGRSRRGKQSRGIKALSKRRKVLRGTRRR
jgi:hypothetical protein